MHSHALNLCRVSYLTIGNAMKHMIDGYSRAHPPVLGVGRLACLWRRIPESLGLETVRVLQRSV